MDYIINPIQTSITLTSSSDEIGIGVSPSRSGTGVLGGIATSSNILVFLRLASAGKAICQKQVNKNS